MKIEVPKRNTLASLFSWLLLASFIVLPVTFVSIHNSRKVQNVPFFWVAGTCFVCGVIGLSWLWWENRSDYIWLKDRVFL
jgi:RsiW-degrading membrane proteinase PrsW (M82 family)